MQGSKVETITPKKAMDWLKRNVNNRPIRKGYAERIAEAIVAGEWEVNGETVKFNGNGDLIDGQHRLTAIVLSGKPVDSLVVRGVPHSAFDSIDTGTPRHARDVLARMGEKHYAHLATAIGVAHSIDCGRNWKTALRNSQATSYLNANPGIRDSLATVASVAINRLMSMGHAAALHFLMARKDKALADSFWTSVATGENLTKTMPAHVLRERLIANRSTKAKLMRVDVDALAIKAWNIARSRKACKCLKYSSDEEFPTIQ